MRIAAVWIRRRPQAANVRRPAKVPGYIIETHKSESSSRNPHSPVLHHSRQRMCRSCCNKIRRGREVARGTKPFGCGQRTPTPRRSLETPTATSHPSRNPDQICACHHPGKKVTKAPQSNCSRNLCGSPLTTLARNKEPLAAGSHTSRPGLAVDEEEARANTKDL